MGQPGTRARVLYLGVDGGSSGTRALLIDATATVHGYGEGGNANHQGQGIPSAVGHIGEAVDHACRAAGCSPDGIALAHFALAGLDVEDDYRALTPPIQALLPGVVLRLSNDVWAGLRAGSIEGHGVAANCGSGCGAVGRDSAGRQAIIPDLGYQFGDSGGSIQIGVDAIRAVVRAWDGRGDPTALTRPVLDLARQPDVDALYLAMYRDQFDPRRERGLAALVFRAARGGDPVATAILARVGDELGRSAAAIAARLDLGDRPFPFVLTGGGFRTLDSPLADAAVAHLRRLAPAASSTLPVILPVAAAALLALDGAGIPVGADHYARLRDQRYGWHPEDTYS